jgi:hypothetical protein
VASRPVLRALTFPVQEYKASKRVPYELTAIISEMIVAIGTISRCTWEKYKKIMWILPPLLSRIRLTVQSANPRLYVIMSHQASHIHCLIGAALRQLS